MPAPDGNSSRALDCPPTLGNGSVTAPSPFKAQPQSPVGRMFLLYNQNSELDVALPFLPSPRRPEQGGGVAFLFPTPFPTSRPTGSLPTGRKGRIQDGTLVSRLQGPLNGRWVKVTLELVGTLGVPQRSPKLGAYPQFPGLSLQNMESGGSHFFLAAPLPS